MTIIVEDAGLGSPLPELEDEVEDCSPEQQLLELLRTEFEGRIPDRILGWPRLQRFLLGNNGDIQEAVAHFRKMIQWRQEADMEKRREQLEGRDWDPDIIPGLNHLLGLMAADCRSSTDEGDLLWVQCDGLAHLDRIMDVSDEDLFNTLFLMCESREDHLDRASELSGQLRQVIQVRDLSGLSVTGVLRNHAVMGRLQQVMKVGNLAYPETLKKMVLLNLPAGFGLLWRALKPLLNPRTLNKFVFLSSEDPISELVKIGGSRLPEALVRARQVTYPACRRFEIHSGSTEYACLRLPTGGEAKWSFRQRAGHGLQFSVRYYTDDHHLSIEEVQAPRTCTGSMRGKFVAERSGLLWLTWVNPGGWTSRSVRVDNFELCTTNGVTPHNSEVFPDSFAQSAGSLRDCGCFSWVQTWCSAPCGGSSSSSSSSGAAAAANATAADHSGSPSGPNHRIATRNSWRSMRRADSSDRTPGSCLEVDISEDKDDGSFSVLDHGFLVFKILAMVLLTASAFGWVPLPLLRAHALTSL